MAAQQQNDRPDAGASTAAGPQGENRAARAEAAEPGRAASTAAGEPSRASGAASGEPGRASGTAAAPAAPAPAAPAAVPGAKPRRKSGPDMLAGSLWRGVFLFAMPVAATSILEQLSSMIGMVVVGQLSGPDGTVGMAAIGANTPVINLLVNLFIGIALGSNVVIANAIGAGDRQTVSKAVHTSVVMALSALAVTLLGELIAEPVLRLLGCPEDAFPHALLYMRIFLLSLPLIMLYNCEAAIFRSVGITKMPLEALAVSTVLALALDLLFVPVLGLGVAGVAWSAVICYAVSAAILFVRLLRTDSAVRMDPRKLRVDTRVLARIVKIGMPAGMQGAIFSLSNIVIQGAINSLGTEVMAASSAALSLEFVCYSVLSSFTQACTTYVGQSFGARDLGRCKQTLKVSLVEGLSAVAVLVAVMLLFGREALALFNPDPVVIELGYVRVCFIFPAYFFSIVYEDISGYLRGFGISVMPAVLTLLGVCGVRILWVAFVFKAVPTFNCIMTVYPVSLGTTALLMVGALLFARPARMYARKGAAERAAA